MTANELNQAAAIIGTTNKAVVFSACIAALVSAGIALPVAFDHVLGEGRYAKFAGDLHAALNA